MKTSPLLLEAPTYVVVDVRAFPHDDEEVLAKALPISVDCQVIYSADGNHFAAVEISQKSEDYAYTIQVNVFTAFRLDVEGCKQDYQSSFNPLVIAVNVCRILYSSAREMVSMVSSRGPHGTAVLPSIVIEPSDLRIEFENDSRDEILTKFFAYDKEQLDALNSALEKAMARAKSRKKLKASKKPQAGSPTDE